MIGVVISKLTENGWVEVGKFWLEDGQVKYAPQTRLMRNIAEEDPEAPPVTGKTLKDGMAFLKALSIAYRSYILASVPVELGDPHQQSPERQQLLDKLVARLNELYPNNKFEPSHFEDLSEDDLRKELKQQSPERQQLICKLLAHYNELFPNGKYEPSYFKDWSEDDLRKKLKQRGEPKGQEPG